MRQRAGAGLVSDPESPTVGTWSWDLSDNHGNGSGHGNGHGNGNGSQKPEQRTRREGAWAYGATHMSAVVTTFLLTVFAGGVRERTVCSTSRFCPQSPPAAGSGGSSGQGTSSGADIQKQYDACVVGADALQERFDAKVRQFDKCDTNLREAVTALKTSKHKSDVDRQLLAAGNARRGGGRPCEGGDEIQHAELQLHKMAAWNTGYVELQSESDLENQARRLAVRRAFVNGYRAYERHAFGYDDLKPLSKKGEDWLGMGVTIVDSLDTMLLMGLGESSEYKRARAWVAGSLDAAPARDISVFETTIRVLGGLLSAFALSGDAMYRDRAQALGRKLLIAFDTTTGIPSSTVNLGVGRARTKMRNPVNGQSYNFGDATTLAEAGTVQLEFHYLARVTGDPQFAEAATKASAALQRVAIPVGGSQRIKPIDVHPMKNQFDSERRSIGASGDSYYEYLLKLWLLQRWDGLSAGAAEGGEGEEGEGGGAAAGATTAAEAAATAARNNARLLEEYRGAVAEIEAEMTARVTTREGGELLAYIGAKSSASGNLDNKMEHLSCFVPGMLALGALSGEPSLASHLLLAKELMATCVAMYTSTATGLAAELSIVDQDGVTAAHKEGLLRPETVESLFLLWRATGDEAYRTMGWGIFQALERHAALPDGQGYTAINGVSNASPQRIDRMDSFFLSETLKYLWLLFSPEHNLPLDEFVLNTEGHPFRIPQRPQGSGDTE